MVEQGSLPENEVGWGRMGHFEMMPGARQIILAKIHLRLVAVIVLPS